MILVRFEMDEDFEESRGWVFSQINDRLAGGMPSTGALGEHTFIKLDQHLLH